TTLSAQDQEILDRHPIHGGDILRDLEGLGRAAAVCALEHHAGNDGSGYPRLAGKPRPHLFSRIVAVADTYDTVTSARRGTQRKLRPDLAMRWIAVGLGSTYDPVVSKVFLRLMGAYPVGSLVELEDKRLALVVRPSESRVERPVVQGVGVGYFFFLAFFLAIDHPPPMRHAPNAVVRAPAQTGRHPCRRAHWFATTSSSPPRSDH